MELSSLIKVSSIKDVFLYGPESLVIRGYLLLSAHHLLISADDEEFWIQLKNIDHIRILEPNERWYHSAHTKGYIVALYTKNFLIFEITILNMEDATNLVRSVELLSGVDDTYLLFPFHFRSEFDITEDGWNIFSMAEEFAPLLVSGEWRISRVNWDFSVCRSYPREVIVPTRITDDILIEAAKFRRGGRFPIVAYYHSPKRTVLLIAGEPLASTNSTFYLQQPGNFTQISQPAWLETNQPSTPPGSGPRQSLAQSTQKALLLSSSAQCPSDSSFPPTTNAASALVSSQSPTSAKSGGLEVIRSFSALSALANFNSTFTLTSDSVATEPIKPSELTEEIPDTEQKKAPSFSSSSGLGINSAYASTSPQIIGGINMAGETRCRADEQILNACLASTTVMLQNYQEQQDHGQRQQQSSTQDPSTSNRSALSDAQSSMGLCRGAILDVRSQSELKRVPASGSGVESSQFYPHWRRVVRHIETIPDINEAFKRFIEACIAIPRLRAREVNDSNAPTIVPGGGLASVGGVSVLGIGSSGFGGNGGASSVASRAGFTTPGSISSPSLSSVVASAVSSVAAVATSSDLFASAAAFAKDLTGVVQASPAHGYKSTIYQRTTALFSGTVASGGDSFRADQLSNEAVGPTSAGFGSLAQPNSFTTASPTSRQSGQVGSNFKAKHLAGWLTCVRECLSAAVVAATALDGRDTAATQQLAQARLLLQEAHASSQKSNPVPVTRAESETTLTSLLDRLTAQGSCVLVHARDGRDRTLLVTSLAQVILDAKARTFRGLQNLIASLWLDAGHPFGERCRSSVFSINTARTECPIFILFLDSVWQLWQQYPSAFEFTDDLLVTLAEHAYASEFGTFLCNSNQEREVLSVYSRTISLWSYLNQSEVINKHMNPMYSSNSGDSTFIKFTSACWPCLSPQALSIWQRLYQRQLYPSNFEVWDQPTQLLQAALHQYDAQRKRAISLQKLVKSLAEEAYSGPIPLNSGLPDISQHDLKLNRALVPNSSKPAGSSSLDSTAFLIGRGASAQTPTAIFSGPGSQKIACLPSSENSSEVDGTNLIFPILTGNDEPTT